MKSTTFESYFNDTEPSCCKRCDALRQLRARAHAKLSQGARLTRGERRAIRSGKRAQGSRSFIRSDGRMETRTKRCCCVSKSYCGEMGCHQTSCIQGIGCKIIAKWSCSDEIAAQKKKGN